MLIIMKAKHFSVCILLMAIATSYFLFNAFSHKDPNDSFIYLGIKDVSNEANGWPDMPLFFRVPFKWEAGKWTAMPNSFSTHNGENKRQLALSTEYPQTLIFSPSILATKIKNDSCSSAGAYETPSDYTFSNFVQSTARDVIPKKVTYGTPTEAEKQKIAPLLKTKVPTYTRADENEKPIGKVGLHIKDFIFKRITVDGYIFISASLNRDLYPHVFSEGYFENDNEGSNPTGEFISYWYVLINNTPVFLGSGLEFIECADYANTQTSQFIFRVSGYNRDGYRLFYNDFKNKVDFIWSYQ